MSPQLSGDELLFWDKEATNQERTSVDNQRAIADKWAKGLAGLTSLVAVSAVIKGQQDFTRLTPTGQKWLIGLALGGFVALLLGSLWSMSAAYGQAGTERLFSGYQLWRWSHSEDARIGVALRKARVLFVAGLVLIALATGTTWVATAKAPGQLFLVTLKSGEVHCGTVDGTKLTPGVHALIAESRSGSAQSVSINAADIKSAVTTQSCPR